MILGNGPAVYGAGECGGVGGRTGRGKQGGRSRCSVARCTMKGPGWPIKGPIELQPRAAQRATKLRTAPLRATLTGDHALARSRSLLVTRYLLTPGGETIPDGAGPAVELQHVCVSPAGIDALHFCGI
ncbi:unnamed protein product [Pleuronectes platessa]|uniref:Uncharacterized protein n=1 Tax=Pleuronectes platessa TaxID=8262 RepID=A0A9N7UQX8_PLEPL|nr:unnamed protein product [Pleuronectes platessa]